MLKHNVMHVQKHVLIMIRQLKSLKFENKKNYFPTHAAGFVRLPYLGEKGEKVSNKFTSHNSIEARQLLVKEVGSFFNIGKVLLKCS